MTPATSKTVTMTAPVTIPAMSVSLRLLDDELDAARGAVVVGGAVVAVAVDVVVMAVGVVVVMVVVMMVVVVAIVVVVVVVKSTLVHISDPAWAIRPTKLVLLQLPSSSTMAGEPPT